MRTFKPRKTPALCIFDPSDNQHTRYDVYLVYYPKVEAASAQNSKADESNVEIVGLQMKADDGLPTAKQPPHPDIQKSFVLRGAKVDPGTSAASESGWIVVSEARRNKILTPSFAQLLDLEYDAKKVEQTADDDDAAAASESDGEED
eukprot:CAMPEP_0198647868 /NCGR_PEP_ID=MMETSP1467-20131203/3071_1 /TAXON_ID=1462469 /ORGANISM="unid. sp., Strain CCMP2135" /LENGTH=146 /DNA_ID=CAMNT_0044383539 /DNA_START=1 /DNA_END=441 /DNA_ORIENTATION=+